MEVILISLRLNARSRLSDKTAFEALSGFHIRPIVEAKGSTCLISSSRLGLMSGAKLVLPVTFAPGRARLSTSPERTGSPTDMATMGIVAVVDFAANDAGVPNVAITS